MSSSGRTRSSTLPSNNPVQVVTVWNLALPSFSPQKNERHAKLARGRATWAALLGLVRVVGDTYLPGALWTF